MSCTEVSSPLKALSALSAMSAYSAQVVPGSSDWLSRRGSRYIADEQYQLQSHQQQLQQQRRLHQKMMTSPPTKPDSDYSTVSIKPDPDDLPAQFSSDRRSALDIPLDLDDSRMYYSAVQNSRFRSERALEDGLQQQQQQQDWRNGSRSAVGQNQESVSMKQQRLVYDELHRQRAAALASRTEITSSAYDNSPRSDDRHSAGSGELQANSGSGAAGYQSWSEVYASSRQHQPHRQMQQQQQQQRLDIDVDDEEQQYRTVLRNVVDRRNGGYLDVSRLPVAPSHDAAAVDYHPRALFVADRRRDTMEPLLRPADLQQGHHSRGKANSDYQGSPPGSAAILGLAAPDAADNFYNERRPTWPLDSSLRRRLVPSAAAAAADDLRQPIVSDELIADGADLDADIDKKSPIAQLIRRYDVTYSGGSQRSGTADGRAVDTGAELSPWQSHMKVAAAAAASRTVAGGVNGIENAGDTGTKTYSCHICPYMGDQKDEFDEHMRHHFDHWCPHCDYSSRTEGRLRCHIKMFHSGNATGGAPDTSSSAAAATAVKSELPAAKRKPKFITCQKCGFKAKEKEELWMHRRQKHMSADKVLECPRCPFATELRHHLEYHLRSHYGSRPYKCDKCTYRCYNQSMLNSHMKSHTNVYQFRCADCQFAAKYCHSLKVHLRQNATHKAAPVLNEDGSVPTDGSGDFDIISRRGRPRGPRGRLVARSRTNRSRLDAVFSASAAALDATSSMSGGGFPDCPEPPALSQAALSVFASNDVLSYQTAVASNRFGGGDSEAASEMALPQLSAFVDNAMKFQLPGASSEFLDADAVGPMADRKGMMMKCDGSPSSSPFPSRFQRDARGGRMTGSPSTMSAGFAEIAARRAAAAVFEQNGRAARHYASPQSSHDDEDVYDGYQAIPSPLGEPEPAQCGDFPLDLTAKARPSPGGGSRNGAEDDEYAAAAELCDVYFDRRRVDEGHSVRSGSELNSVEEMEVYGPRRKYRNWSRAQATYRHDGKSSGSKDDGDNVSADYRRSSTSPRSIVSSAPQTPGSVAGSTRRSSNDTTTGSPAPAVVAASPCCSGKAHDEVTEQTAEEEHLRRQSGSQRGSPSIEEERRRDSISSPANSLKRRRSSSDSREDIVDEKSVTMTSTEAGSGSSWKVSGHYLCSYCEIDFHGSRVLHAMHMAYHGADDPFQCSSCGQKTADRVAFFLHLARVAHN